MARKHKYRDQREESPRRKASGGKKSEDLDIPDSVLAAAD